MKKTVSFVATFILSQAVLADSISMALLSFEITPQILLFFGFIAISFGIFSSGYALAISLGAYAGCVKEARYKALIPALAPASQGIYSLLIGMKMIENITIIPLQVAFAGVLCGLPCFFSALGQAKIAASAIRGISTGQMGQGQALFLVMLAEIFALLGPLMALMMMD